jgi:hypothetical protein
MSSEYLEIFHNQRSTRHILTFGKLGFFSDILTLSAQPQLASDRLNENNTRKSSDICRHFSTETRLPTESDPLVLGLCNVVLLVLRICS